MSLKNNDERMMNLFRIRYLIEKGNDSCRIFYIEFMNFFNTSFSENFEKKYDIMMKLLKQISNARLKMIFHAIIECDVRD